MQAGKDNSTVASTDAEVNPKEVPITENVDEDERDPPALVVYLVEPFGFAQDNKDLHR